MASKRERQISINGTTLSFGQLIDDSSTWLQVILPYFRASTTIQKESESFEQYCDRLFSHLYYKRRSLFRSGATQQPIRRTTRSQRTVKDDGCRILNALGIDIIKHNPKISRVVFKNSGNCYRMNNLEMERLMYSIKRHKSFTRTTRNVRIGVELEFIGERGHVEEFNDRMRALVGDKYECVLQYNHNDGKNWVLGTDGSLNYDHGERGYEMTSPVLNPNSKSDMKTLESVMALIKEVFKARTNNSCGTHVHMSFKCAGTPTYDLISHFAKSYSKNESSLFDKLVPSRRQGSHCRWCRSTSTRIFTNRYQKLNFRNVDFNSTDLHLEFRQLDGTLDYNKLSSWIKLQKMFIEITMDSYDPNETTRNNDCCDYTNIKSINFEDAIMDSTFSNIEVESLLKMSRFVA